MKIGDVKIGDEYSFEANWKTVRRRLRAEEIVQVPVVIRTGDRFYRTNKTVLRRQVRCTVLDWETGEPTGAEMTYEARAIEPFAEAAALIAAKEARQARVKADKERVEAALDRLGVPVFGRVHARPHGGVEVILTQDGVEALVRAALL